MFKTLFFAFCSGMLFFAALTHAESGSYLCFLDFVLAISLILSAHTAYFEVELEEGEIE